MVLKDQILVDQPDGIGRALKGLHLWLAMTIVYGLRHETWSLALASRHMSSFLCASLVTAFWLFWLFFSGTAKRCIWNQGQPDASK